MREQVGGAGRSVRAPARRRPGVGPRPARPAVALRVERTGPARYGSPFGAEGVEVALRGRAVPAAVRGRAGRWRARCAAVLVVVATAVLVVGLGLLADVVAAGRAAGEPGRSITHAEVVRNR